MYAFVLNHEQGRVIRVKIPKELEGKYEITSLWLSSRYDDIDGEVDFMLTDFGTVQEEDASDEKLDSYLTNFQAALEDVS